MLGRVKTDFEYRRQIKDKSEFKEVKLHNTDFYGLVMNLIDSNSYLVCGDEIMYPDEIRFDYVNHEIYLPVIKCDYMEICEKYYERFKKAGAYIKYGGNKIGYNNSIEKYYIYKDSQYSLDRLYFIQVEDSTINKYYIELNNVPLRLSNMANSESRDLFMRYVRYSYGIYDETDTDLFYSNKKSDLTYIEKKILKEMDLNYYGEFIDLECSDVRQYKLEELLNTFDLDELCVDTKYNIRRIEFEAELMLRIETEELWFNWTKGDTNKLISGTDYFAKYKEGDISFIFKASWLKQE